MLLLGLAGSGKTHLASRLLCDELIEEDFANGIERERENIQKLADWLRDGKTCVISERKYLAAEPRAEFVGKLRKSVAQDFFISFICFENDIKSANHNCQNRGPKRGDSNGEAHVAQNNADTCNFVVPDNAIMFKIHRVASAHHAPSLQTPPIIRLDLVKNDANS